jgi:Cd2+/Zn2+-exporting ATPase
MDDFYPLHERRHSVRHGAGHAHGAGCLDRKCRPTGQPVKQEATIEAMAKVTAVAFDKTGTLTFEQPEFTTIQPLGQMDEMELLCLAASAEKLSEHPLGRAIVQAAMAREVAVPDPEEFTALPGLGVRACIQGGEAVVGRPRLPSEQGIEVREDVAIRARNLASVGHTNILVARNNQVAGMLVLEDTLRPQAGQVITRLKKLGIRTVLVTGDNTVTAERIAGELGISEVHAEVLPAQKVEIVKQLQAEGLSVAFVGDGVNDGPALATANVGVAMSLAGTDVAIETAEIALLSDDLIKLPHLLNLSRQAMRAITQNLIFSLSVLAIAVGLAIPGILSPVSGALLHELSSIPVITNSARLIGTR